MAFQLDQERENAYSGEHATLPRFAHVMVNLDGKVFDEKLFTYKIPEALTKNVQVGVPVLVPFGPVREALGVVVSMGTEPPVGFTAKNIHDVLDGHALFDGAYLNFLKWVSMYYGASLSQVIECALPANLVVKTTKRVTRTDKPRESLELLKMGAMAEQTLQWLEDHPESSYTAKFLATKTKISLKKLSPLISDLARLGYLQVERSRSTVTQSRLVKTVRRLSETADNTRHQKILDILGEASLPVKQLAETAKTTSATLSKMAEVGLLAIEEVPMVRDPAAYYRQEGRQHQPELSTEQQRCVDRVLTTPSESPWLLYGVTGSGKTEVYLSLAEKTLAEGKSVLVLVPEIALASPIAKRFVQRFGVENVAIWHSQLSTGERTDTWRRVQSGELRIVIGARSAIYTPVQALGLIVMDEEHENSYKQDSPAPRYHARTLAQELIRRTGARMIMGSATPDIVTYTRAVSTERLLTLPQRFGGRNMAEVTVVDMRKERRQNVLSGRLREELALNLELREQSLILINRRGFFTLVQCADCQHVFQCPYCQVSLTLHRANNHIRCHYCGYSKPLEKYCPQCASWQIVTLGTGTQRVEEQLKESFPDARLLRMDSDVGSKKNAYRSVLEAFAQGEADILVGTQMIAKGLDIPNVTLVGVVNADTGFALPDYKANERGFQLLTQVAGRAGRGGKPGRVILQSLQPDHPVIDFARNQDYQGFYHYEKRLRDEQNFPPTCQLIRLIVSDPNEARGFQFIKAMAAHLKAGADKEWGKKERAEQPDAMEILGPTACTIPKIQNRYRFHCLVKSSLGESGQRFVTSFYRSTKVPEGLHFLLDVDTETLL